MILVARQGGLSISESADLLGFCSLQRFMPKTKQQFCTQKHVVNERDQRRKARQGQLETDRKVTVTQITMHYNSGMQKSISEHTMHQTSKWIGCSCTRLDKYKK